MRGFCGNRRLCLPVSVKLSLPPSAPPPPYCLMSLGRDLGCGRVRLLSLPQEGSLLQMETKPGLEQLSKSAEPGLSPGSPSL